MKLLLLAGDGIGAEIMAEAEKILACLKNHIDLKIEKALVGGASFDAYGKPLTEATLALAKKADAILLGAVGGTQWDNLDWQFRPERALLALRSELNLFANLRPAICFDNLIAASSLKAEKIANLDILIVRELVSGIYFGKPRGIKSNKNGEKIGFNTLSYTQTEIERIAHIAFQAAQKRNKKLTSVDKANVLESMVLWREVVSAVAKNYPDVQCNHLYIDNAVMQLIANPKQFDVILAGNMFGDILSDGAAQLTGSIGMLASASLGSSGQGMFEPVHGSAPDIAGKNIANPIAMILSLALAFRYSLNQPQIANIIENSVRSVIASDYATYDIASEKSKVLTTSQMGDLICEKFKQLIKK